MNRKKLIRILHIAFLLSLAGAGLTGIHDCLAQEMPASIDAMIDNVLMSDTAVHETPALFPSASKLSLKAKTLSQNDKKDRKAQIYRIEGSVKVLKRDAQQFKEVAQGMILQKGDTLLTGKKSSCDVALDSSYKNTFHIPESTKAEFRSIEPTDIFLEDGTIFSVLDDLSEKDSVKISTPTAIASVRGTRFVVHYMALNSEILVATFDFTEDGKASLVDLQDILPNGSEGSEVNIPEGQQIKLAAGQVPDASQLTGIDPAWLEQMQNTMEEIEEKRSEESGVLPETAGEGGEDNPPVDESSILENGVPKLDPAADIRPEFLNPFSSSAPSPVFLPKVVPPPDEDGPGSLHDQFHQIFNMETVNEIFDDAHEDFFQMNLPEEEAIHVILDKIKEAGVQGAMEDPAVHSIYHVDTPSVDADIHRSVEAALNNLADSLGNKLADEVKEAGIQDPVFNEAAHVFGDELHHQSAEGALDASHEYYHETTGEAPETPTPPQT